MYYSFVKIQNFKGIRDLRIDFDKPPRNNITTLVGLNESGKTTILEALNYFAYGSEDLDPSELTGYTMPDVHDLMPISQRANFNGNISLEFGVEMEGDDETELKRHLSKEFQLSTVGKVGRFTIEENYPFKDSRYSDDDRSLLWSYKLWATTGRQKKPRPYNAKSQQWQSAVSFLKGRLPRIIFFPNFLFDFPELICIEEADSESGVQRAPKDEFYTAVLQDVLDALNRQATIQNHLVDRYHSNDTNDNTSLHALLLEMGRHITSSVFREWNSMFVRPISEKRVSLSIEENEYGLACIRFQLEDADGIFDIRDRSLGFRWFFVYLLLTYYRGFRKAGNNQLLFLFDEPASNLHSTAQQQLLKSFENLAERCRIMYATHSQHLINPAWLESTYVIRNTGLEYESTASTLDYNSSNTNIQAERYRTFAVQHPNQSTYFQPVLDVLDYRPSQIENVPNVVMVEGKNDYYSLTFAHEQLALPYRNYLPGSGSGSLDTVIQLYTAWGRQFIILLDSDGEGVTQKRRYINKFGSMVESKLLTLEDVNPEWSSIELENLFEDNDKLSIQQTVYPAEEMFSKGHFNRAVQEMVASRASLNLSSNTKSNFQLLVNTLSELLTNLSD